MNTRSASAAPLWLRALGGLGIVLVMGSAAYAVSIAIANFSRIGV